MKTIKIGLLILLPFFISSNVQAQKTNETEDGYVFTENFRIPVTNVKNQYRSGTCWSFSGLSFLEAELLRMGKGEVDLSEMFVVNHCYRDKADRYVRMHGNLNFGGGGAFHDVLYVLKNYGLVTEKEYPGLNYATDNHVHGELDEVLSKFMKGVIENKNKKITPAWKNAFSGIIDSYLGELPENAKPNDFLGLNADNYVELTSFSHHPFYSTFILEVPDNWLWGSVYNLPINEFEQVIDNALKKGYTVAWAADVSHKGFKYNKGIAVIPETDVKNMGGLEKGKWEKLSKRERESQIYELNTIVKEKKITQEFRQEAFDNYSTTDDHGMLIVGTAKDQKGNDYYIIKNSWGTTDKYKGYFYASKAFVIMQATNIMVNKESIPEKIREKLSL
ncbi:MAG: aminopeptidase [Bacteroidales bacterium]|nr:aminopeptidase [Bacteroidales bacterium]